MTHSEGVPPWARPVLEALLGIALREASAEGYSPMLRRSDFDLLASHCTAALAAASGPDAGTGEPCPDCGYDVLVTDPNLREPVAARVHAPDCPRSVYTVEYGVESPPKVRRVPPHRSGCGHLDCAPGVAEVVAFNESVRPAPASGAAPEERDWMDDPILGPLERMENLTRGFMNHHISTAMLLEGKQRIANDLNAAVAQRERAAREAGRAETGEVVSSGMVTGRSWEGGPVPRFAHLTLSVTDASALPLGTPVDLVRRRGKEG